VVAAQVRRAPQGTDQCGQVPRQCGKFLAVGRLLTVSTIAKEAL